MFDLTFNQFLVLGKADELSHRLFRFYYRDKRLFFYQDFANLLQEYSNEKARTLQHGPMMSD